MGRGDHSLKPFQLVYPQQSSFTGACFSSLVVQTLLKSPTEDDEELVEFINTKRQHGLLVDYDPVEVSPPTGPVPAGSTGTRRALIDSVFA